MNKNADLAEQGGGWGRSVNALAVVLVSFGVLAMVTAYTIQRRNNQEVIGTSGTSSDGRSLVPLKDWREVEWIEDFQLTERSGEPFDSRDMQGQVWVVSFFFSSCPGPCKQQNDHVYRFHKKWGPRGVKFVSITCDPENDTPEALRDYAHRFEADDEDWLFLTGDLLHVRRIGSEVFGVVVDRGVHMDRFTVIDRWGKVRGHFDWHDPKKLVEFEESLGVLLEEREPPAPEEPAGKTPPEEEEPDDSDAEDRPETSSPVIVDVESDKSEVPEGETETNNETSVSTPDANQD